MTIAIENDNEESSSESDDDYLKFFVIGEPRCGKTTFIRACLQIGQAQPEYSVNGVKVYPCKFNLRSGMSRLVALHEIPGEPDFQILPKETHYEEVDVLIFMYAIDDPSSFEMLSSKWLPEISTFIDYHDAPLALVGNKLDLRNNQEVIERLALDNQVPVTTEQNAGFFGPDVEYLVTKELSSNDSVAVLDAFRDIWKLYIDGLWM